MADKVSRKNAYSTKTPKGDFTFKHQEGSKPYVTKLQMALARGENKSGGSLGFPHRTSRRHSKPVPKWLA